MAKQTHAWGFFRAGGVDQVILRTGEDVKNLRELDQKLWVALACPVAGTEIDEATLSLVDADKDGRIRPPEILAAIDWCSKIWKNLDLIFEKGSAVPLASFDTSTDEGKAVLASAKRILEDRGKKGQKQIELDDVLDMEKVFVATRFNGDGIVPADSADDEEGKRVVEDVISAVGSVVDRSGKPGIDLALVTRFFDEAKALVTWHEEGAAEALRPLGEATDAAADAVQAVAAKVDDWFTRCQLAAFDPRAATALIASDGDLQSLAPKTLEPTHADIERMPLAAVGPGQALPLDGGLNPAWAARVATLRAAALEPLLGPRAGLTEADWRDIRAKIDPFLAWRARRPAVSVAALPVERLFELVAGDAREDLERLIREDAALEAEYAQIASVQKALRLRRDLLRLLRNFVSFADFYGGRGASFQAGRLFLDARTCELVVYVNDAAKHAQLAGLSSAFLAYCDIVRTNAAGVVEKKAVVAAITAGDTDDLMVGRNGVFYDRKGQDWDATVTSIIQNPVSVRQAFWTPYKRLVRLIEEQIAKRAADKEKESSAKLEATAAEVANADKTKEPPAPPGKEPEKKKVDVGMVAALGVAVAGVATFLSSVLATFLGLGVWMPFGVLALVLAISGPSMLIAWLKLRRRNLGPILDANGWAVNTRAAINVPFGGSLTALSELPEGSSRALEDPFAEKPTAWRRWVFLAVVLLLGVLWLLGKLDRFLPGVARSTNVLPAASALAPATAAPSAAPAPSASK